MQADTDERSTLPTPVPRRVLNARTMSRVPDKAETRRIIHKRTPAGACALRRPLIRSAAAVYNGRRPQAMNLSCL